MTDNDPSKTDAGSSFDPAIQSEKISFDAGQMVVCMSCVRRNPPTRPSCLYCGAPLELPETLEAPINKGTVDIWGSGWNIVSVGGPDRDGVDLSRASEILSIERGFLESILRASAPLPISRSDSETEAARVQNLLSAAGLLTEVVPDRDLLIEKPQVRLAGMTFADTGIVLNTFNSHERVEIDRTDIVLLVEGFISVSKVDQNEKRKGRTSVIRDEVSTMSDELVLDIYTRNDTVGFRVMSTGFDYSCLGSEKGLLAANNLRSLIGRITDVCPDSKSVSEFRSLRPVLGRVWEVELRRETKGLHVTGFGKREIGSVFSTSNLEQFTKFSRLQRVLL